jgi:arylsulfatase A-like enzyme
MRPGATPPEPAIAIAATVPDVASRDVVSTPFVPPPGAALVFGMGIESLAIAAMTPPVEFRVSVLDDGAEEPAFRAVIDPVARAEDRRWVDARVDLARWANRRIRLRLSTAAAGGGGSVDSLPVWGDPVVAAPPAGAPPWNVILVSLDTLRAASVSTYGSPRDTMPNLDRMVAREGVVFDSAYAPMPHTLPSHMSMFTSLYRRTHGVGSANTPLAWNVPTLPERMRAGGYATAAFTEDGFLIPSVGFERGFSAYSENRSPELAEPLGQSAQTFGAGLEWLARHGDEAFFLFLHTYEVHFPYTPPPPYDQAFESIDAMPSQDDRDHLRYEQEARYLDDQLATLLDAVDAMGLAERTLLVVMADHGEEFMEHGRRRHSFQLYSESIHVPLMMRLPGAIPAGLHVSRPVSLVDVAPTILELVGLPIPAGVEGESQAPVVLGGRSRSHRVAVFSEAPSSLSSGIDQLSVQGAGFHCIFRLRHGTAECFDPIADPDERTPLRPDDPRGISARVQASLFWSLRPASAIPTVQRPPEPTPLDSQREEKLRALGYVN